MAMLSVNDVEYTYRAKYQTAHALKGVSASFDAGKMYAIVGSSGSGKTTLLSLLAGLDLPTAGQILFEGTPTSAMDRDAWRLGNVSVIYQNFNLFAHLTVLENAAYPLYLKGGKKGEAEALAKEKLLAVGLQESQFGRFPAMLSGGEQQRVAIARALAAGSTLILADEPTGNLDEENSENIFDILQSLAHEEGCCVIVVTHDLELATKADAIITLRSGRVTD